MLAGKKKKSCAQPAAPRWASENYLRVRRGVLGRHLRAPWKKEEKTREFSKARNLLDLCMSTPLFGRRGQFDPLFSPVLQTPIAWDI